MTEQAEKQKSEPLLKSIIKGPVHLPPRLVLYGVHGIGKSTLGAAAPRPIFIQTEEGANEIDVDKFPTAISTTDVLSQLRSLYREPHEYQTVVIDSADWLEDFIHLELKASYSDKELSFGKDSVKAAEKASEILTALNHLRVKRGMASILIAHSDIKRFDSPMTEPYDRYVPKLQKAFGALLQEWADAVLFATYDVIVKKEEVGFNKEVRRGISTGDRVLFTEERPAFLAKNRYRMPVQLPMKWEEIEKHIPYYAAHDGATAPEPKK
jgi:hypothetical protein